MKRSRHTAGTKLAVALATGCLALTLAPARRAEGCVPIPDASGLTDMVSRRAVIWVRPDSFDIMFQNQYEGDAAGFAWVIPLPGVPTEVGQPSEGFVDALDGYTVPLFENRACVVEEGCCDRPCTDGGVLSGRQATPATPGVSVWRTGKLGDLDYAVISAATVGELVAWLEPRGYALPAAISPLVGDYLDRGFVFFAAKIAAPDGGEVANVPVARFTFDRAKTKIIYPLRISAFNREAPLDTTIWIVGELLLPKAPYSSVPLDAEEHTKESYQQALDEVMAQNGGTTFAIQLAAERLDAAYDRSHVVGWPDGVSEMRDVLAQPVTRLRARLNPKGTNDDLELEVPGAKPSVSGWYLSPCPGGVVFKPCPDDGCALVPGARLLTWGLPALLVLLCLAGCRRGRAARGAR